MCIMFGTGNAPNVVGTIHSWTMHAETVATDRFSINKIRTTALFLLITVALCFGTSFINSFHKPIDVAKVLEALPQEDRESLEWLFRDFWDSSYVLFGSKPMSICCMEKIDPYNPQISEVSDVMSSIGRLHLSNLARVKGWEVWKKYRHLFPSSKFVFFENHNAKKPLIILINKQSFLKKIQENVDYFREMLLTDITAQKIFDDCLKSDDMFGHVLKNHDGLIGILLGYGKHNAQLFWRRNQIENANELTNLSLTKRLPAPSPGFSTLDEEYSYINAKLKPSNNLEVNDFNGLSLRLPCFVADPQDPETQQLKVNYLKDYKKIVKLYQGKDFLKTTLEWFCNG